MKQGTRPSCDDVLEAFACESDTGKATLEKYLRDYPEYAETIIDFATEITLETVPKKEPLSARELDLIESAWKKHIEAGPKTVADPFAVLTGLELGKIAKLLNLPKQVLTAIRDRAIVVASIPKRFLEQLAAAIQTDPEGLLAFLAVRPTLSVARSHKSEAKPKLAEPKTFEQILIDAGVAPEDRKKLMEND